MLPLGAAARAGRRARAAAGPSGRRRRCAGSSRPAPPRAGRTRRSRRWRALRPGGRASSAPAPRSARSRRRPRRRRRSPAPGGRPRAARGRGPPPPARRCPRAPPRNRPPRTRARSPHRCRCRRPSRGRRAATRPPRAESQARDRRSLCDTLESHLDSPAPQGENRPMFVNRMGRYEVLSEDALEVTRSRLAAPGDGARHRVPASGGAPPAGGRRAGRGRHIVRLDPDFVLEQAALAPESFTLAPQPGARLRRRRRAHGVLPVQGPPFVRRGSERREATLADYDDFCRIAQRLDDFDTAGFLPWSPNDRPLDSRHLDMQRSLIELTDKPHGGAGISEIAARGLPRARPHRARRRPHGGGGRASTRSSTSTRRCATTTGCSARSWSTRGRARS